jgi:hypothetical protein
VRTSVVPHPVALDPPPTVPDGHALGETTAPLSSGTDVITVLRLVKGLPGVPLSRRAYAALPTSDKTQRVPAMILSSGVSRYSRSVNPRERAHHTSSGAEPYATSPRRSDVGPAVAPRLMHALRELE